MFNFTDLKSFSRKRVIRIVAVVVLLGAGFLAFASVSPAPAKATVSSLSQLMGVAAKYSSDAYVSNTAKEGTSLVLSVYKDLDKDKKVSSKDGNPLAIYTVAPSVVASYNSVMSGAMGGATPTSPSSLAKTPGDKLLSEIAAFVVKYSKSGYSFKLAAPSLKVIDDTEKTTVAAIKWAAPVTVADVKYVLAILTGKNF